MSINRVSAPLRPSRSVDTAGEPSRVGASLPGRRPGLLGCPSGRAEQARQGPCRGRPQNLRALRGRRLGRVKGRVLGSPGTLEGAPSALGRGELGEVARGAPQRLEGGGARIRALRGRCLGLGASRGRRCGLGAWREGALSGSLEGEGLSVPWRGSAWLGSPGGEVPWVSMAAASPSGTSRRFLVSGSRAAVPPVGRRQSLWRRSRGIRDRPAPWARACVEVLRARLIKTAVGFDRLSIRP